MYNYLIAWITYIITSTNVAKMSNVNNYDFILNNKLMIIWLFTPPSLEYNYILVFLRTLCKFTFSVLPSIE